MYIKKIQIKDFKILRDVTIDSLGKINVYAGGNGEGKSTVLNAIQYAITDYLPENLSNYINRFGKEFEIGVEFAHEGNDYSFFTRYAKKSEKSLVINGEDEEDQPDQYLNSDAVKYLQSFINPQLTLYSSISAQGEAIQILSETPSNRLAKLKAILGLDRISAIVEKMKMDEKECEREIDVLRSRADVLREQKFDFVDVPKLDQDITELKDTLARLMEKKTIYDNDKAAYDEYIRQVREYRTSRSRVNELKNTLIVEANANIDKIKATNKDIIIDIKEYITLKDELSDYQAKWTAWSNQYQARKDYEREIGKLEEQVKGFWNTLNTDPEYQLFELPSLTLTDAEAESVDQVNDDLMSFKKAVDTLTEKLSLAKAGKCPTCGKDYCADIPALEKQLLEAEGEVEKTEAYIKSLKEKISEYALASTQLQVVRINRENLAARIEDVEKQISEKKVVPEPDPLPFDREVMVQANIRFSTMTKNKEQSDQLLKDIEKYNADIIRYTAEVDLLEKTTVPIEAPAPAPFDETAFEKAKNDVLLYEQRVKEIENLEAINQRTHEARKKNIAEIESIQQTTDSIEFKRGIIRDSYKFLDKDFSAYVIEHGTHYINIKMNEFFQKVYPKYNVVFKQDKKSIEFFYGEFDLPEEKYSPAGLASGFEKQLLALSFRFALCTLQNLGIFVLDEIDSDAELENSMSLYRNLLQQNIFEQIHCITHRPETIEMLVNEFQAQVFEFRNGAVHNH